MIFPPTPSQTIGPYFAIGLPWQRGPMVVKDGTPGLIRIRGTVWDGAGDPARDAMIETWQADPEGRFADLHGYGEQSRLAGFRGFGRCAHDDGADGFEIVTVKPGKVPGPGDAVQAPHIDVSVFARGLLHRCVTRIYFEDEPEANDADPVLASVPEQRRATLLARPVESGYRFEIHLQGPNETVFFAI